MPFGPDTHLSLASVPWVWLLVAALIAVALFAYWRTTPELPRRTRVWLAALRTGAFVVLTLLLLDPRAVTRGERDEPARVVLLVDRSASMSLPANGWAGGETRFDAATRAARTLEGALVERGADVETVYFSDGAQFAASDSVRPDGQGTNAVRALEDVARRYEGEHLAAAVVLGDGVDTEASLVRRAPPPLSTWTVGFGDTLAPNDVRVAGVDYSPIVRAPSRAIVAATVASTGPERKRVHVRLSEGTRTVFETDTTLAPGVSEATVRIPVRVTEPGRRELVLAVESEGADLRADNNRRDIVIEVEKSRAKILIVDLTPAWELAFVTALVARDPAYACEVFVTARRTAAPVGGVKRPDEFVPALSGADAVVLASVSDEFLTPATVDAIRRFVTEKGGGLLVLPGPSSLFETGAAWGRMAEILPVRGSAPMTFTLQYTLLGPGAQAASNPATADLVPLFSQVEWQERAPLLGFYAGLSPTAATEVLLGVRGRSVPALAYATAGKGRVATVAAGPLWRWKFVAESNGVYDELVSRLFDVLTRGEESGRFVLTSRKNVFDAGERPELYAEIFNEKLQPVTGGTVRVEIARVDSSGAETPLEQTPMQRESPDSPRLVADLGALPAGRYVAHGSADLPGKTLQSKPLEFRVSTTSVEFQRTPQDRDALVRVARRQGGDYLTPDEAAGLADRLSLDRRRVPTVSESVLRASAPLFLLLLALLSGEWLLRKRAGMI
jgi:hypothetical protein